MNTTLNKIRSKSPCADGWAKLLKHLGKPQADDEPLSLITILDSNGLDDALWCLQAVDGHDREIRLYAVWCARQVQHLMTDKRSLDAIDVAERFANGLATENELDIAWDAAGAAGVARFAAWDASRAAGDAAWAARDAAWDAARAAAWAARDAAWDAARDAQEVKSREMFCDTLETKELKEKNTKQVGGTHYLLNIEPCGYIIANNIGYLEGNVIKYVTRHKSKGGRADILKAIHYLEKILEVEYGVEE